MHAPNNDSSKIAVFSLKRSQIADARFVQASAIIDYQNVARLRVLHGFQKNVDASKMSNRKGGASETLIQRHGPNARRTGTERNF
jgi:hypothetical protein